MTISASSARWLTAGALALCLAAQTPTPSRYDTIIQGGTLVDGSGGRSWQADVGVRGDRIAAIGDLKSAPRADDRCEVAGGSRLYRYA